MQTGWKEARHASCGWWKPALAGTSMEEKKIERLKRLVVCGPCRGVGVE